MSKRCGWAGTDEICIQYHDFRHFMGLMQIKLPLGGKLKWKIFFSILGSYAIAERLRRHLGMPKLGKIWSAEKGFPTCCGGGRRWTPRTE